jgi:hypothetical protein
MPSQLAGDPFLNPSSPVIYSQGQRPLFLDIGEARARISTSNRGSHVRPFEMGDNQAQKGRA